MLRRIYLTAVMIGFLVSICYSESFKEDFEKGSLKGWEIEGDAKISGEQKHGGTKSLFVPKGSKAIWTVSKENKYGKVTFWLYDSKVGGKITGVVNGPRWGVTNEDGDCLVLGLVNRNSPHIKWGTYFWCSTLDNSWYTWRYPGNKFGNVKQGWHKFVFNLPDEKTLEVTMDDDAVANIPIDSAKFTKGFTGVYFEGGKGGEEKFYFDDIEIVIK